MNFYHNKKWLSLSGRPHKMQSNMYINKIEIYVHENMFIYINLLNKDC